MLMLTEVLWTVMAIPYLIYMSITIRKNIFTPLGKKGSRNQFTTWQLVGCTRKCCQIYGSALSPAVGVLDIW